MAITNPNTPTATSPRKGSGLGAELRSTLKNLADRDRRIVEGRLGIHGGVRTLEEIGASLALTRERVRQLESTAYSRIAKEEAWPAKLLATIEATLRSRTEPLWLALLPTVDPFFEDHALSETVLERLIDTFSRGQFHCFMVEGLLACSAATEKRFYEQRQAFQSLARQMVPQRPTRFELAAHAESLAANCSARELHMALFRSVEAQLQFARLPGSDEAVLVAFGHGVEHVVLAVLEESDEPLHWREIHRRACARANTAIETNRLQAVVRQAGIFLFARGTYGVRRHLQATERDVAEIQAVVEEIILTNDRDRQWHAHEILEQLPFDANPSGIDLTAYTLAIVLAGSRNLRSLGRMIWVAASSAYQNSNDRIDVTQAFIKLLREAGRPMTRIELTARLKDWRGLGKNFQLQPTAEIIALAPGRWGLRARDLPLNDKEVASLLDVLFRTLSDQQIGLHQSELLDMYRRAGTSLAGRFEPYWILSLARTDARFRVFYGGFIGLAEWGSHRRRTLSAVAKEIAVESEAPHQLDFLTQRMSRISGHEVSRGDATRALREAGFAFDGSNDVWNPPRDDDADADAV